LRLDTAGSARLHFEERDKGSIEPGKLADMILVDRDPLTCPDDRLAATRVLGTIVAGRLVLRAP
jgi:predicted amidohydrolase YtcJ